MLTRLRIENLALIESLSIEFGSGFNVITGETGAGKSVLIRGLDFLLGSRVCADTIRNGKDKASVVGEFLVGSSHSVFEYLASLGIAPEQEEGGDSVLILKRYLNRSGRSQCWVNDVPVTVDTLKKTGGVLLDLFSQHENQRLVEEATHIDYLDQFLSERYRVSLCNLNLQIRRCLDSVVGGVGVISKLSLQKELLEYWALELKELSPSVEDYRNLCSTFTDAEKTNKVREALKSALVHLEEEGGIAQRIKEVSKYLRQVDQLVKSELGSLNERLEDLGAVLDDVSYEISRMSSLYEEEGKRQEFELRLEKYDDLFHKLGAREIEDFMKKAEEIFRGLDELTVARSKMGTLLGELCAHGRDWEKVTAELTKARKQAALSLKKRVERELSDLCMPGSRFEVEFSPVNRTLPDVNFSFDLDLNERWKEIGELLIHSSEKGAERARFLLSSNSGEPVLPLSRVASGGEMSRIMLALKKALAEDSDTCVLVFDEIDSGISGRVADVVGLKMKELSKNCQVICISHLPQVAVYADNHFRVEKLGSGNRSLTSITALGDGGSAEEVARLLSGEKVSSSSLANARNLLKKARKKGKLQKEVAL